MIQPPFLRCQRERRDPFYVLVVDFMGATRVKEGVYCCVMVALDGQQQGSVAVARRDETEVEEEAE